MTESSFDILQVSWREREGGAERVASELARWLRARGHRATLAVGARATTDPGVVTIPHEERRGVWFRLCRGAEQALSPTSARLARVARHAAEPLATLDRFRGVEPMRFPGTRRLLELTGRGTPDLLHCHNLHRDYFDLRELPRLSRAVPTVLTLHDAWLLSGHCAHSFACERWRTGCGACPDLSSYPPVRRDATAFNWARKRDLFAASRLYVATPSRWLMGKVEASMLLPGVVEARVIPNGVDLAVFRPGDRAAARAALGLPQDAHVLLFAGNRVRENPFKDYATLRDSLARLGADRTGAGPVICVALGDAGAPEHFGRCEVRPAGFEPDPARVATYYQAADLYVHAARADTFPTTVLEALACGTPVVASAVGGIPEQVRSLRAVAATPPTCVGAEAFGAGEGRATGWLVPPGNAGGMAEAIRVLLLDDALRAALAANAAADARRRFDEHQRFGGYLSGYREILEAKREAAGGAGGRDFAPPPATG
jgi:glycosyltransferase involved in cell wall biosynthesis